MRRKGDPKGFPPGIDTKYDPQDESIVMSCLWHVSDTGYLVNRRKGKTRRFHREVLGVTDRNIEVDHINGNRLDNRRENLRACSHAINQQNRTSAYGKSGIRGVYPQLSGAWFARVKLRGKPNYLGTYSTKEEAAQVAKEWRLANMPGATG